MIERQGGQRILAGTPATLRVTFSEDGSAANPGACTVSIARLDGSLVTPEPVSAEVDTGYEVTYDLAAAHTADLDVLTVTWVSDNLGTVVTTAEIVGAHLFTVTEARAFDNAALSDPTQFPTAAIEEARSRIEDAFEEICGVSFVPRLGRVDLSGNGSLLLMLPLDAYAIRSVETRSGGVWTAFSSDELDDLILEPWGGLTRERRGVWPRGTRNVRVTYEHGYAQVPLEIKRAGLTLLKAQLRGSDLDPRATSFSDGLGTYRLVTEGLTRGAWFSIPEVNAILARYERKVPVVG